MKTVLMIVLLVVAGPSLYAQKADWKEMHQFHNVMSSTFHPAEENNLQPLKDSAQVLMIKAKKWKNSPVPAGYNKTITRPVLQRLVASCENIHQSVKTNKSDAELKLLITKAHEIFHELMEKCKN